MSSGRSPAHNARYSPRLLSNGWIVNTATLTKAAAAANSSDPKCKNRHGKGTGRSTHHSRPLSVTRGFYGIPGCLAGEHGQEDGEPVEVAQDRRRDRPASVAGAQAGEFGPAGNGPGVVEVGADDGRAGNDEHRSQRMGRDDVVNDRLQPAHLCFGEERDPGRELVTSVGVGGNVGT